MESFLKGVLLAGIYSFVMWVLAIFIDVEMDADVSLLVILVLGVLFVLAYYFLERSFRPKSKPLFHLGVFSISTAVNIVIFALFLSDGFLDNFYILFYGREPSGFLEGIQYVFYPFLIGGSALIGIIVRGIIYVAVQIYGFVKSRREA